jgi:protein TonB
MSERHSAFRNSHTYGIHSQRPPLQRYGAGIAMVLLVHAGAIVAIKSGLDIRKLVGLPPPIVTRTIPITPPVEQPVAKVEPKLSGFTVAKPEQPTLPEPVAETLPSAVVRETASTNEGPAGNADPVVTMARSDPRHPLTQPAYPAQSRRLGEEGSVQLLVFVLPNGRVSEATVAVSSGYSRLDEAAVREALRSWRLLPNTVDGIATGSWNRIGITFRLKN